MGTLLGCDIRIVLIVWILGFKPTGDLFYFINMLKTVSTPRRLKHTIYI